MTRETEIEALLHQPPPEDDLGVLDFLEAFALAISEGNGEALAELWETPCFVLSQEFAHTLDDNTEIKEFCAIARDRYGSRGVTHTRPQIVRMDEITDRIVNVRVRWPWLDSDEIEMGADVATYTLRLADDGEWRVRIAVIHGPEALS
jgi:hypothetical protein